MITATLLRNTRGHVRAFHCEGHAHYAEAGKDIVCAAVSALMQSAVLGLTQHLRCKARYRIGEGELWCVLPVLAAREQRQADAILETMRLGLESIRMGHAKHLRIIEKEVKAHVFHEFAAFCSQKGRGQLAQRPRQRRAAPGRQTR